MAHLTKHLWYQYGDLSWDLQYPYRNICIAAVRACHSSAGRRDKRVPGAATFHGKLLHLAREPVFKIRLKKLKKKFKASKHTCIH